MDLSENMTTKESINGEDIRVIYRYTSPSDDHNYQTHGFIPLTIIPVVNNNFHDGYHSDWEEVKNQVLNLNFKERSQVPKTVNFIGKIGVGNTEINLITKEDYFTALKVADLCGHPLDVTVKTFNNNCVDTEITNHSNSQVSNTLERETEPEIIAINVEKESNEERNGFVILENDSNRDGDKDNFSNPSTPDSQNTILSKSQIESLKNEITVDVTKRIITKLSECLSDLSSKGNSSDNAIQTEPNAAKTVETNTDSECAHTSANTPSSEVIHVGIICDNCECQIIGIRYKCSFCLDYDLCERCESLSNVHNDDHSFLKMKQPLKRFKMPKRGDDVYLSLDVDLPTGRITNIGDFRVVSKPSVDRTMNQRPADPLRTSGDNVTNSDHQTNEDIKDSKNIVTEEPILNTRHSIQQIMKHKMTEKRAIKIAKRLEKLKIKSQLYTNLLHQKDDQTHQESAPVSASVSTNAQNPSDNSNKTLFLSGLFIGDETIPDGTRMPPSTKFKKTWKVRNTGTKVWTGRTTLRYVWGQTELEPHSKLTEIQAPALRPGEEGKISIRFTAPKSPSTAVYQSHWRLHHRGQPFGQRLICKVLVDPQVTAIVQPFVPKGPISRKYNYSGLLACAAPVPAQRWRPINQNTDRRESLGKSVAMDVLNQTNDLSKAQSDSRHKPEPIPLSAHKDNIIDDSEKKDKSESPQVLREALTAVKEIRFKLDDNEQIPMKANVKSHTTTPANTPFNISPPKSPEPTSMHESNNSNENNVIEDDKADDGDEEESASVISLSSSVGSDEFVVIPLPSCFDLNVPINAYTNVINTTSNDTKSDHQIDDITSTEIVEQYSNNEDNDNTLVLDLVTGNWQRVETTQTEPIIPITETPSAPIIQAEEPERTTERASDTAETVADKATEAPKPKPQMESQPQFERKPASYSTNPFRDNETENVIHVLPESIVTGALSAAAHVYNNVSRALFPRNEGLDSRHFAWVTSPPPAAIPLPDCVWESKRAQYQPQEYFSTTTASTNSTFTTTSKNAKSVTTTCAPSSVTSPTPTVDPKRNKLSDALTQLWEMGFWNQKLNQELLEKNNFDVNDTIEELLSPDRCRRRNVTDEVVSRQPKQNSSKGFIEEFD